MTADELLQDLVALFSAHIDGAEFCTAYPAATGRRLCTKPVVTCEIDSETVKPAGSEVKFKFRIYLPAADPADRAEALFAAMCRLAGEAYPGFSAISRGAADRDRVTGLLTVTCTFTFSYPSQNAGDGSDTVPGETVEVLLNGIPLEAGGVKVTANFTGQELTAVWEDLPFAQLRWVVEYTVELTGFCPEGLERLQDFTVQIGETVYRHCRWKTFSVPLRKAVFIAKEKGAD